MNKKPSKDEDDDDDEPLGDAQGLPALIPDGEYGGVFKRVEQGPYQGRQRYFLWFVISEPGSYLNTELYLSCPLPKKGNRFSQSSNLGKAYAIAMNGAPRRLDRITKKAFKNKLFRFTTRTVTMDGDGMPKKEKDRYSVIDRLISAEVGK